MKINASDVVGIVDGKDHAEQIARDWFSASQELLYERGDDAGYEVYSIAQAATPPHWDGEAWVFAYHRQEAVWFEYGTDPHTIRAKDAEMLLFEWPDMPSGVEDMFRDRWQDPDDWLEYPQVMFKEVEHPGTEELAYLRDSRDSL